MIIIVTRGEGINSISFWMRCDLDRFLLTEGINLKNGFPNCFVLRNEEEGVAAGTYRIEATGEDCVFIAGETFSSLSRVGFEQSSVLGCELTRKFSPEMLSSLVLDTPMFSPFYGMSLVEHNTKMAQLAINVPQNRLVAQ